MGDPARARLVRQFDRFVKTAKAAGYVLVIDVECTGGIRLMTEAEESGDDIRGVGVGLDIHQWGEKRHSTPTGAGEGRGGEGGERD